MTTVTAPGADRLPWDVSMCEWRGPHRHSGRIFGCVCDEDELRVWVRSLEKRWGRFHDNIRARLRKEKLHASMLAGAWQLQDRGAPHAHLVLPGTEAGRRWIEIAKETSARYDFGYVDMPQWKPTHPLIAASYLSKYLTAAVDLARPGFKVWPEYLPRKIAWVSPRLTRETYATLRMCEMIRRRWAFAQGYVPHPPRCRSDAERAAMLRYYFDAQRERPAREDGALTLDDELRALAEGTDIGVVAARLIAGD